MDTSDVKGPHRATHLKVVPLPKAPAEESDRDHCIKFLHTVIAKIENDEFDPMQIVMLITEQEGDIHRLSHLTCNVGIIEAIGLCHMAAGDMREEKTVD